MHFLLMFLFTHHWTLFGSWGSSHGMRQNMGDRIHVQSSICRTWEARVSPHLPGDCGSWKWPSHSYVVFVSLFPGLVEQGGVKIEPLPKEVRVYLLTTSRAPYCGEQGGKRNTCARGRLWMSRLPMWVAYSPA